MTANGQAMAVVHESISRPSALAKVFAGDNLPCTFQKRRKNLEGTFLQFDLSAGEVEFARAKIATALYYAECLLTQADGLSRTITAGSDAALALRAEQFERA